MGLFFFKFLSENYNYVQVYKTHKLCWITACNTTLDIHMIDSL